MDSNDKIFDVDFYGYLWLASAFGGAIVVAERNNRKYHLCKTGH